ncbi:MAG TPA: MBL fold metallo-hydrolase [Nocardioides sp.]|nr:MBL fold metallo-hydrolase [Nocardioides sp.]
MTYTGEVTPGGAPDVRELAALTITKLAVDEKMSNNCYLLTCRSTGENLLVDAADQPESLFQVADGAIATIVTTHQHWDHHRGLAELVRLTGATTVAGSPDADAITEQTSVAIDRRVDDGDTVTVGDCALEVIRVTGHTPGSICLLYRDPSGVPHLFTGDSLFPGGVGNTFGDADAFGTLIDDVETKLFGALPDDTWFYPGHGNDSTLGAERPHLAEWRERGW